MRLTFLPFSQPSITEEDIAAVTAVLRSKWITTGRKCLEFENKFTARVGSLGAVAVTSATGGMHLLLKTLNINPGDEIITPSLTWVSTPNLIELTGAKPVWADVDRDNLMTSAEMVEPLITDRTRAIIPVHFAGAPADLDPLRKLAHKKNIPLIEDAAHAVGSVYRDHPVGSTGVAVFSFHPIKNFTTGEGGLITANNQELLDRLRVLRFHGLGKDAFDRKVWGRRPQAQVLEPGYKYNLTDLAAALGLSQLNRLDEMNARRRTLAEFYLKQLAEIPELRPISPPTWPHLHVWHLFVVRLIKPGLSRNEFMERLRHHNIGSGLHFLAAHTHNWYRQKETRHLDLSNTEWNSERLLSLPLFPDLTEDDLKDVIEAVKASLIGK